jgi:hypothetical protein
MSATLSTATDAALDGLHPERFLSTDDETRRRFDQRRSGTAVRPEP